MTFEFGASVWSSGRFQLNKNAFFCTTEVYQVAPQQFCDDDPALRPQQAPRAGRTNPVVWGRTSWATIATSTPAARCDLRDHACGPKRYSDTVRCLAWSGEGR